MVNEIGEAAGEIWQALVEENKTMTIGQLKKKTKLSQDFLYMGIGWLAREDKLQFPGSSETMEVSLK